MMKQILSLFKCGDFIENLLERLSIHYAEYKSEVQKQIMDFVLFVFYKEISVHKTLEFFLHCPTYEIPTLDLNILFSLLKHKTRYTTVILPNICRVVCNMPADDFSMKIEFADIELISRFIYENSMPSCDENKRMSAAHSLCLLRVLLNNGETGLSTSIKL